MREIVFVAAAKAARPPPGLVKHLPVQVTNKAFIQQFTFGLSCRPSIALNDIQLLPSVQVGLGADVYRYQSGSFIRIKRGGTWRVEKVHVQSLTRVRGGIRLAMLWQSSPIEAFVAIHQPPGLPASWNVQ